MSTPTCPRCRGSMDDGYVADKGHSNVARVPRWFEGPPVAGLFGLKIKGRPSFPVKAFRCRSCGYLESYAREDAAERKA